jgi:hypothetical protein
MAITRTATSTQTYTRTVLIKLQVDRVLSRVNLASSHIAKILQGIDNKWIAEVSVYGMNAQGYCSAELFMKMDWERNQFHVSVGKESLSVDNSWTGGISLEVEKTLGLFLEFVQSESLTALVHTRYAPGVDREAANRALGFVTASPVQWSGGFVGTAMTIPELDEFTVGLRLRE